MLAELFEILKLLGISLLFIEALMLFFWAIYLFERKVKIVDIAWCLGFIVATFIYFHLGDGYIWRKILVLFIVSIWSLRLTYHLIIRYEGHRDDPRYIQILDSSNKNIFTKIPGLSLRVLVLFLFEGFLATILSIPFVLMSNNPFILFQPLEVFGLFIWMGGLVGESMADWQLYQFKQNPMNSDQVLQEGLWKYSRHPNYFFEWIIWMGYAVMAFSAPWGWLAIFSPLMILYLLLRVSGIPLLESEAIRSKGELYRAYRQRTSAFIPWFRKDLA